MAGSDDGRLGRDVSLEDGGRGYLAIPASGRGPGVVVLQEWWGLVDHVRDVCDRLGAKGSWRSLRTSTEARRPTIPVKPSGG